MQFSSAVLPAPFGPTTASSSPSSAVKRTRLSATRPPNLRVTSRISRGTSAPPSALPPILLYIAIAFGVVLSCAAEIELLHVAMRSQFLGLAVEYNPSALHDVAIVGNGKGGIGVLLHQ